MCSVSIWVAFELLKRPSSLIHIEHLNLRFPYCSNTLCTAPKHHLIWEGKNVPEVPGRLWFLLLKWISLTQTYSFPLVFSISPLHRMVQLVTCLEEPPTRRPWWWTLTANVGWRWAECILFLYPGGGLRLTLAAHVAVALLRTHPSRLRSRLCQALLPKDPPVGGGHPLECRPLKDRQVAFPQVLWTSVLSGLPLLGFQDSSLSESVRCSLPPVPVPSSRWWAVALLRAWA